MATQTRKTRTRADRAVLRGVAWDTYCALRDEERNDHLRMSYLDGTLTLMSPGYLHDRDARRLEQVVDMVTTALGIPCQGTRTSTLRREGPGPARGVGKEPDDGFYFGPNEARMRTRPEIDLDIDPPPDLAIEVDHSRSSARALRLYARLGVPEVWRFRVRTRSLWFGRLAGEGYEAIDRSLHLPMLTPGLVVRALDEADRLGESAWRLWLLDWARALPDRP